MNAATDKTRNLILRTAEKLFAERGIDRVSIRQINLAAGQKNSSATQYHFDNKIGLLEALFDERMAPINERRLEMLGLLEKIGSDIDLRRLVEVIVMPVAEELQSHGAGYYYIPIVAQVSGHPDYHAIARHRDRHATGLQQLLTLIRQQVGDIPQDVIMDRFGMALRQVFSEMADYQRLHATGKPFEETGMSLFVNGLIDAVTAQFAAPVSEATRRVLDRKKKKSA